MEGCVAFGVHGLFNLILKNCTGLKHLNVSYSPIAGTSSGANDTDDDDDSSDDGRWMVMAIIVRLMGYQCCLVGIHAHSFEDTDVDSILNLTGLRVLEIAGCNRVEFKDFPTQMFSFMTKKTRSVRYVMCDNVM